MRKGGWLSSDYVEYLVETETEGSKVKIRVPRKDADFYRFRQLLKQQFPHMIVPPLPAKNSSLKEKTLMKRRSYFQRFLQVCLKSEEFKQSFILVEFLHLPDSGAW